MKKFIAISIILLCGTTALSAQNYEPRESWPFVHEFFQEGAARTVSGTLVSEALFNVSVADGCLYYIAKDEKIMKADMKSVYTAKVGNDVYFNVGGKLYNVLSELDCGSVLSEETVDIDALAKVDIGYGVSSASASAMNVANLMDGSFSPINKSLQQTESTKNSGKILPLKNNFYVYVGGKLIPATRHEISSLPGVDKKEFSSFLKKEKIKWKETASLEKIVVFLNNQSSN